MYLSQRPYIILKEHSNSQQDPFPARPNTLHSLISVRLSQYEEKAYKVVVITDLAFLWLCLALIGTWLEPLYSIYDSTCTYIHRTYIFFLSGKCMLPHAVHSPSARSDETVSKSPTVSIKYCTYFSGFIMQVLLCVDKGEGSGVCLGKVC